MTLQSDVDELRAALRDLGRAILATVEPLLLWLIRKVQR